MRIFLTGATGFIGSYVTKLVVREGHEVHALLRPGSDTWRIRDVLPSCRIVTGDFLDSRELAAQVARIRPDLGLHLAWYAEPGRYLNDRSNLRLLAATSEFALRLGEVGCKRLVAVGTCLEYDQSAGCLSETSATRPNSLYAAAKHATQLVLLQVGRLTGMEVAWTRLFYQYGPFERLERLVPSVICSLLRAEVARVTRGDLVRDFLHVEDVAAAIWAVARSRLSGPVNVGSGRPVPVREVVETIGDIMRRPDLIAFGLRPNDAAEPKVLWANNRRLRENTTWTPRFGLEDGLRGTVRWWAARCAQPIAASTDPA